MKGNPEFATWIGVEVDGESDGNPVYSQFECSKCRSIVYETGSTCSYKFCPNCGNLMKNYNTLNSSSVCEDDDPDDNFELILLSAIRYALGRRTYIVGVTCGYAKKLLSSLSEKTLYVMERDIREHGQYGEEAYGDDMDLKDWTGLLDAIHEEMKGRGDENA